MECPVCSVKLNKLAGEINRAKKKGLKLYCGRKCSGIGRRVKKTKKQKIKEKSEYDRLYRENNKEILAQKKIEYFKKTYDPKKAAIERKKNMKRHVNYCRRREYREWKKQYDQKFRAQKIYGPLWESFILLMNIEEEVLSRASKYDIYQLNGTLNKRLQRRREYERLNGNQSENCPLGNIKRNQDGRHDAKSG